MTKIINSVIEWRVRDGEFNEGDHPRAENGQFGAGAVAEKHGWKKTETTAHGTNKYEHKKHSGHKIIIGSEGEWTHNRGSEAPKRGEGAKKLDSHLQKFHNPTSSGGKQTRAERIDKFLKQKHIGLKK